MPAHRWAIGREIVWTLLGLATAAEWLRAPSSWWLAGAVIIAGAALGDQFYRRRVAQGSGGASPPWISMLPGTALVLLVLAMAFAHFAIGPVDRDWPAERERRVNAAFQRLSGELRSALHRADRLSAQALPWADGDRSRAFTLLDAALPRDQAEMAVAILEPTGVPWAWAGRHRLAPEADGDSIAARFNQFYAILESRRHTPSGRVVLSTVLVWADSAVPRADRSLAARFGQAAGVQLRVYPPGDAPRARDIFDFVEPTTAGDRLLFSVQPVPPDQEVAESQVSHTVSGWVGLALLVLLLAGLVAAAVPRERFILLAALLWCCTRAPLGRALGLDDLFSPAHFRRGSLGPFAASPGHLLLTSILLLLFAIWLAGRRLPRHPARITAGVVLLLGAPYLVTELGRGIIPPLNGVPIDLWLTWQLSLSVATSALIALAAALFRGAEEPGGGGAVALGVMLAVVAAVVGVEIWVPRLGWPEWYTFLWTPALLLVARPAPRWVTVIGIAVVAGSAAALVTWGAELNARIVAAQADLARLGDVEDPLAAPYLERFADQISAAPEPTTASGLFLQWRRSYLAGQEFPVRLALWERDGLRHAELSLDSLDLPTPLLAALVKGFDTSATRAVVPLFRVPGRYYVLLQRLPSGRVLTAAVGPRSRLLAPARVARLLRPPADGPPLYEVSLSPPSFEERAEEVAPRWQRLGNEARFDRHFTFPGGSRHVHASVQLRPLPLMLVRGALLVALDLAVLAVIWGLATLRPATLRRGVALRRLARSFQVRLALTLALFFILPAAGFTAWGLGRLGDEADRTRDLLITATLKDAVLTAGGLLQEPGEFLAEGVRDLSNRLDADLVLYSGGRLVAASAPILEDLSLVEPLIDARVFQRLTTGDELELTRQATTYVAPVRVGYRVAQAGPPGGIGILATPQLASDWRRTQDQRDLAFGLLLATLAGGGAALLAAQLVARALSRPVADLRQLAAALGRGEPLPAVRTPPVEFEQVFGAFERMAADIRASQAALESARQRTATVLANVATGVVALAPEGTVLLSNGRARQLLGAGLAEGTGLADALGPGWAPLVAAVGDFLRGHAADAGTEVEVGGRMFRLQLARLGREPGGAVLAIDDLTDVTQAARVLAWGEMARQVAHEIKNPLTPIRLGVQHLRRVGRDRPEQFEQALAETSDRILSEIDRLDTIARAFSRFGLPGGEQAPLEQVDLVAAAGEVAGLYRLAADGVRLSVEGKATPLPARLDEVKEVLGNLLENARNAGARQVHIRVAGRRLLVEDDGKGIPPQLLPRIFEPRFSTTTSGSGLGLAIVRRLVEGWGARVVVTSELGRGTTVAIEW